MKKFLISVFLFFSVAICFAQTGTYISKTVTGSTQNVDFTSTNLPTTIYLSHGGGVSLTGNFSMNVSPLPPNGTHWYVFNPTGINLNGNIFCCFGVCIGQAQLNTATWIEYYVANGSIQYFMSPHNINTNEVIDGAAIIAGTLPLSSFVSSIPQSSLDTTGRGRIWYGNSTNTTSTLYAAGNAKILIGDGSDINSKSVTGDVSIASTGVTILDSVITNAKIKTGANIQRQKLEPTTASQVLINNTSGYMTSEATLNPLRGGTGANTSASTGFATVSAGSWTVGAISEIVTLQVSFEANYTGDFKIKMPYAGTVTGIYAYATKAIAGTDDGTIVAKNNGGTTMTNGTITFTASDPRGTAYTVSPSANNTFAAGDLLTFTTAKVTNGGVVQLSITVTRTN